MPPATAIGGVHVNQQISGCDWDDETEKVHGFNKYGYNGEDFLTLDMETETWIADNPQAEIIKQEWDGNKANNEFWKNFLTNECIAWLKTFWTYGKSLLQRIDLPSVSLLQKSPSSPVSCHATGFYPDRAMMFWRKDGEEIHEDVELGEILPNHDGSFQMSVDLILSSVPPEDWRRYDCVFHLSGVKDHIVTTLDKAVIRTNRGKTAFRNRKEEPSNMTVPITAAVVVLAAVLIAAVGFTVYKKKKASRHAPPPVNSSELSELTAHSDIM
ncbi:major histocompatibility complex class I-related protein 1-like [Epinephelus lanceolatus]